MTPAILYYAIPGFILLLALEAWFASKENKNLYEKKDTCTSLVLGVGNVVTGFITKAVIYWFFSFLYQFRIVSLPDTTWWFWILLFFADDFSYYWFHRTAHSVNWFWASHVVHHSSKYYNLAAALRQTWTGNLSGSFIFWAWMPLVGFQPVWILFMQQISLIYQFWIHTETIHKLPKPFEWFLNTPSHHRVHHGRDLKYLDKNHAGILIIWDRLFNTFQEEEHPVYGLTANINSYNPVTVALKTWKQILTKSISAGSVRNSLNYFIKPPGWSHDGSSKTTQELREEAIKKV